MAGPATIGRYRLEGVIGAGSFATAHRARDERLDDTVVVKVLAENHSLNPEIRERFIAEGRSLRRVRSPHVVTVHDIGESDRQQPYLVLEHADRGSLADRVAARRAEGVRPSRADVLVVARTLAAAIEAVHAAQLVHRDLSPGNVLLQTVPDHARRVLGSASAAGPVIAGDERLLLADLGLCKDLARSSGLTVAGGTEGFRPPEQRTAGSVDGRADLWALSALIRWFSEDVELPDGFDRALARSLADDPEDRHPDVQSWLADVEGALAPAAPEVAPSVDRAQPRRDSNDAPTDGPRRSGRRLAVALAGIAAGGLAGWGAAVALDDEPVAGSGGAAVAIDGPSRAEVGEAVTFTADVEGLETWVWTLPTGAHVLDAGEVAVTARSPGRAEVVLRARAPDGEDLEAVHRFTIEP